MQSLDPALKFALGAEVVNIDKRTLHGFVEINMQKFWRVGFCVNRLGGEKPLASNT